MTTITLKLGGPLVRYSPSNESGELRAFKISEKQSLNEVIKQLGIPGDQPLFVILNATVVNKEVFDSTYLNDGDELSLMPPIQAG